MPLYQYKCHSCGKDFEVSQSYSDDPVTDCPYCQAKGSVKKVYGDVGVVYHGSGYYCTDHAAHGGCTGCPHKE